MANMEYTRFLFQTNLKSTETMLRPDSSRWDHWHCPPRRVPAMMISRHAFGQKAIILKAFSPTRRLRLAAGANRIIAW